MISFKKLRLQIDKKYRDRASNILRRLPIVPITKKGGIYFYDEEEVITKLTNRCSTSNLSNKVINCLLQILRTKNL